MTLDEFILEYEPAIRLSFFFGIFAIMAIWELKAPRRALTVSKVVRWSNNLGLVFLNSFILRFLFPAAALSTSAVLLHVCARVYTQVCTRFHTGRRSRGIRCCCAAPFHAGGSALGTIVIARVVMALRNMAAPFRAAIC